MAHIVADAFCVGVQSLYVCAMWESSFVAWLWRNFQYAGDAVEETLSIFGHIVWSSTV